MTRVRVPAAVLAFACAASAGVHADLVPEHLRELPPLGVAFIAAALALTMAGAAVCWRPTSRAVVLGAAVLLGGVALSYIASRTAGIPLLDPAPEQPDVLGVVSVLVELVGVACALWIARVPVPKVVATT